MLIIFTCYPVGVIVKCRLELRNWATGLEVSLLLWCSLYLRKYRLANSNVDVEAVAGPVFQFCIHSWLDQEVTQGETTTVEIRQFYAACLPAHSRRFGVTKRGHFCLVPRYAKAGDLICIPFNSKVPFVFRREDGHFINIGECYVHGAMHAEASSWEGITETEFELR